MLLKTVTAFTAGAQPHARRSRRSATPSCPSRPLNAAIALSILFLGPEIVRALARRVELHDPPSVGGGVRVRPAARLRLRERADRRRPATPRELPLALVSFNLGVELGQLGFIALVLPLERPFRALGVRWPRWVQLLPGYVVGSLGAFWTIQRVALLLAGAR